MAEENGTVGQNRAWQVIKHLLGVEDGKGALRAVLEPLAIIAITFASTTAIAQPFYVPSGSMQPTLAIGDAFIAAKYPYGYSRYSVPFALGPASSTRLLQKMPQQGDVVVFRLPRDPEPDLHQARDRPARAINSDDRAAVFGSTARSSRCAPTARARSRAKTATFTELAALHRDAAERQNPSDLQMDLDRTA